jgi:hypothetical protein
MCSCFINLRVWDQGVLKRLLAISWWQQGDTEDRKEREEYE